RIIAQGNINLVVDEYLSRTSYNQNKKTIVETPSFIINDVQIISPNNQVIKTFDPVEIRVKFMAKSDILDPGLYIGILSLDGQRIAGLDFKDFQTAPSVREGEQSELGFFLDALPILPGNYQLELH